ncbi:hypothetical protein PUNSTDRAFT_125842 [Punctularia strigosozonata HHB-11173 SS5]|uniref:uncharacterized protein n=1 Tax=Punctularia strigosozonata (strain HHB-11173) TaxID=741275 RepID=UPI0004417171|nr:uncharacterized protein PUNSTDRAFT_125842 [Punctularia strigosozonata HHB-11173 SS5]EIN09798.1 hypothetical protein PUNSTDRAFT_125842 [Punctularia strigosozonata HHB-11173 SS5]
MRAFTRQIPRACPTIAPRARSIHSAFTVLGNANTYTAPPPGRPAVSPLEQHGQHNSPLDTVYVVSRPDPADAPYDVPLGAFPTSAPYAHFTPSEKPDVVLKDGYSSTAATPPHPTLTAAAPQNAAGVGESAAVRHATAPGELHERGGSHGGLGLMDKSGTSAGQGQLADRNPPPIQDVGEKMGRLGVDNAWKERK